MSPSSSGLMSKTDKKPAWSTLPPSLVFNPEDGSGIFLRNASWLRLHGNISQKVTSFITTAAGTSNPTTASKVGLSVHNMGISVSRVREVTNARVFYATCVFVWAEVPEEIGFRRMGYATFRFELLFLGVLFWAPSSFSASISLPSSCLYFPPISYAFPFC